MSNCKLNLSSCCVHWLTTLRNNAFLKHMLTLWDQILHKKLPALKKPYDERVDILITEFAGLSLSAADDISASFRDSLENIKDNVLAHRRRLKEGASDVFADFDASTKDIWRLIKTECEETCKLVLKFSS